MKKSALKKNFPPLEYYEAASGGVHSFMMRTTEYVVSRLVTEQGAEVHYYAFMQGSIEEESIDEIVAFMGGQEVDLLGQVFPLAGLNAAKDKVSGSKVTIVQGAKDVLWQFDKVTKHPSYLGIINLFSFDYGRKPSFLTCQFVIAYDMEEAVVLMTCLRESVRVWNRKTKRVMDVDGIKIEKFRQMNWEQIFLANNASSLIKDEVNGFFESKNMYAKHSLDWRRGMLFVGPPGNGKTAVCRAIATTSKVPVVYCLLSNGDAFSMLQSAHNTIVRNAPCIAIFEDADSLGADEVIRSSLLNMLDGLVSCEGVLTIATTNCPERLDSAFTGRPSRFDSLFFFGNPDHKQRKEILLSRLGKSANGISSKEMDGIVKESANLSAAAVQEIAVCALLSSMKRKGNGKTSVKDLRESLLKVKKHMQCSKDGMDKWTRGSIGFSVEDGTQGNLIGTTFETGDL